MFQSKFLPNSRLLSALPWKGIVFSYRITIWISALYGSDALQTTGWVAHARTSNNSLEHVFLLLQFFSAVLGIWFKVSINQGSCVLQWKWKHFTQAIRDQGDTFKCLFCSYIFQIWEMMFSYDFTSTGLGSIHYFDLSECEWHSTLFNFKNGFQYVVLVLILKAFNVLLQFISFSFNDVESQ